MRLSVKGLAWSAGLLWGAALFVTAILNLVFPLYGFAFLHVMRSLYPGYAATSGLVGAIVLALYGVVDGAVCGALFGWLYNLFAKPASPPPSPPTATQ
jgi:hypothetical protein